MFHVVREMSQALLQDVYNRILDIADMLEVELAKMNQTAPAPAPAPMPASDPTVAQPMTDMSQPVSYTQGGKPKKARKPSSKAAAPKAVSKKKK